jgi:parallel beta-helix repeat protein
VTLDCDGHAVRGRGGEPQDFGVAIANGATGATIKNCEVSGFLRGIRLRDAHNNRILQNSAHDNGNFAAHVGYGIDVAGSRDNLFQDNRIFHNADEGIHIGTGSHGNTLIGNQVSDNFRENIYVLHADRGVFRNNSMRGGGANSLFLKHGASNRFEHNTFADRPVTVRGDAHDNVFLDNEFSGAGIHFQAYEEKGALTRPTKNVVTGGKIRGAEWCLRFSNASGNIAKNIILDRCREVVASTAAAASAENTLIGIADAGAFRLDKDSLVHVGWQLQVTVKRADGSPVVGATVKGLDAQKNLLFEAVTAADGTLPPQEVIAYTLQGTTRSSRAPSSLQVSVEGEHISQELSLDGNKTMVISLPHTDRRQ